MVFAPSRPKRWLSRSLVSCIPCSSVKSNLSGLISTVEWTAFLTSPTNYPHSDEVGRDEKAEFCHAIARDDSADFKVINRVEAERFPQTVDKFFLAPTSAPTSQFLNLPARFLIFRTSELLSIWKRSPLSLVTAKSDLGAVVPSQMAVSFFSLAPVLV